MNAMERLTLRACTDIGMSVHRLMDEPFLFKRMQYVVCHLIIDNFEPADVLCNYMDLADRHLVQDLARRLKEAYRDECIPSTWRAP